MWRELRVLQCFMLQLLKLSILVSPIQVEVGGIRKSLLGMVLTWRLGVQQDRIPTATTTSSLKDNQILTEMIPLNFCQTQVENKVSESPQCSGGGNNHKE